MFILGSKEKTRQFRTDLYTERYRHEKRQINIVQKLNYLSIKQKSYNLYIRYIFKDTTRAIEETGCIHN